MNDWVKKSEEQDSTKRNRKERARDDKEQRRFKPEPAGFVQGARIRKPK